MSSRKIDQTSKPSSSTKNEFKWICQPDSHKPRIRGFESRFLSLKKLLEDGRNDNEFRAIGVVGPRGIGKTALCQAYYYHGQGLLVTDDNKNKESQGLSVTDDNNNKESQGLPVTDDNNNKESQDLLVTDDNNNKESQGHLMTDEGMKLPSFCPKVWISMPRMMKEQKNANIPKMEQKNVNIPKIELVKAILENLGVEEERIEGMIAKLGGEEKKDEALLDYVLRLQLTGKKYLVVLDGVQSSISNVFEKLKKSSGTVIMTSVKDKVVTEMGGQGNMVVPPLFDPVSLWAIFQDNVNKCKDFNFQKLKKRIEKISSSGELKLLGKASNAMEILEDKVVMKCEGLPLTAVVVADTMLGQIEQMERKIQDDIMKKDGSLKGKEKKVEGDSIVGAAKPEVSTKTKSKKADKKNDATKKDDFPKVKEKKDESESNVVTTASEATLESGDKNANEVKDETKKDGSPKGEEKKVESESSVVTTKSEATLKSEDKNANEEKDEMKNDGSSKGEEKKVESESSVVTTKSEATLKSEDKNANEEKDEMKNDGSPKGEEKQSASESSVIAAKPEALVGIEGTKVDEKSGEVKKDSSIDGEEKKAEGESTITATTFDARTKTEDRNVDEAKEVMAQKEGEEATTQEEDPKEESAKKEGIKEEGKEVEDENKKSDNEGKKETINSS